MGIPFRILSNHAWALGFAEASSEADRWLFMNPDHTTLVPLTPEPWSDDEATSPAMPRSLLDFKESFGLKSIYIVPAGTVIQTPFVAQSVPDDVTAWLKQERFPDVAIEIVNDILLRFRSACGLLPECGFMSPVSEYELLEFSVQFFEGIQARSKSYWYSAGVPGPRRGLPTPRFDQEIENRFELFLNRGIPPLGVRVAFNAYSDLYRRRYDEALLGFWQALELEVNQVEQLIGIKWKDNWRRPKLENRILNIYGRAGLGKLDEKDVSVISETRNLRNNIVHGSLRLSQAVPSYPDKGMIAIDQKFDDLLASLVRILDTLDRTMRNPPPYSEPSK